MGFFPDKKLPVLVAPLSLPGSSTAVATEKRLGYQRNGECATRVSMVKNRAFCHRPLFKHWTGFNSLATIRTKCRPIPLFVTGEPAICFHYSWSQTAHHCKIHSIQPPGMWCLTRLDNDTKSIYTNIKKKNTLCLTVKNRLKVQYIISTTL